MTSRVIPINEDRSGARSYYCSMKFRALKIDLQADTVYNCHTARPHAIDYEWLKQNPGQLFNDDINVAEREMMLRNERNPSCGQNCWAAEDNNTLSIRQASGSTEKTHTVVKGTPEIIDITLNVDCNLTCSYCCKEFSRSWLRDIAVNGDYVVTGQTDFRFRMHDKDRERYVMSQPELKERPEYQLLLNEVKSYAPNLSRLLITGGEPFLDNQLAEIIQYLELTPKTLVSIYTGLGVSFNRFTAIVSKLQEIKGLNYELILSAENTGKFLEFNRYGIKWAEFRQKLDWIAQNNIRYHFQGNLMNLSLIGFPAFFNEFKEHPMVIKFGHQPRFMAPHVLDTETKKWLIEQCSNMPAKLQADIRKSISATPTDEEKLGIRDFLQQFIARRSDLDLSIFPTSFITWINSNVV